MPKLTERLETLFQPMLESVGLSVVRVLVMGKKKMTLQVMIERQDNEAVGVDDCIKASRQISEVLDVEDPIKFAYTLEVTSPGIDRPLLKPADFQRFGGSRVDITLLAPHEEGVRRYKGILRKATDEFVELEVIDQNSIVRIAYKEIGRAKLDPEFKFNKVNKS